MLNKIVNWAEKEDAIRSVILTGSRGAKSTIDEFSDFDVALFASDPQKYVSDDSWINKIDKPWLYIQEKISFKNHQIPTRLIIFEDGVCVDISLWDSKLLEELVNRGQLPFACQRGYSVLLDKDNIAVKLPAVTDTVVSSIKPSQEEFLTAVKIFFFEAFNCAKYLARSDLWHAKLRDWTTKEYLLKMLEWNEAAMHNWNYNTFWHGKKMQSWVDKETWVKIHKAFGHFDAQDSWKALDVTIDLFRQAAEHAAEKLGYDYPFELDKNITGFVQSMRKK